jgi:hypothetical protein
MMRIILFVFVAMVCGSFAIAQAPDWAWAKEGVIEGTSTATGMSEDGRGNIYAAGKYSGRIVFDTVRFETPITMPTYAYLVKYSSGGKLLWGRTITGANVEPLAISADANGELYVMGTFRDSALFESTMVRRVGVRNLFLAKYAATGNLCWVKSYGAIYYDWTNMPKGLVLDSRHNVILCGSFDKSSALQFDSYTLSSNGNQDIFLAKIDSSGNTVWAKHFGGKNSDESGLDLALDQSDNLFMVGSFAYSLYFDTVNVKSISSAFMMAADEFVAKFDGNGNAIWARSIGGQGGSGGGYGGSIGGPIACNQVAVDTAGNVIVGGTYKDCDLFIQPSFFLDGANGSDIWFAKFSASGTCMWANSVKSMSDDDLFDVTTDAHSNIYVGGAYGRGCLFGSDTAEFYPGKLYGCNLFVCQYDADGKKKWLKTAGTDIANTTATAVLAEPSGAVTVAGNYSGTLLRLGKYLMSSNGGPGNGFIARLETPTGISSIASATASVLYPNPADKELYIRTDNTGSYSSYTLLNAMGQIAAKGLLEGGKLSHIMLPSLRDGVYYLQLWNRSECAVKKVVIEQR